MSEKNKKILITGIIAILIVLSVCLYLIISDRKKEDDQGSTDSQSEYVVPDGETYDYKEAGLVKIDSYRNIKVDVEPDEDAVRDELAAKLDDSKPLAGDIRLKKGEYAYVDYTGSENGVENDDYGESDALILIGEHKYMSAFEDALVGMEVGSSYSVPIQYPADYSNASVAGKTIEFTITVKAKFNDHYASKMSKGRYKTVDAYMKSLKTRLKKENLENLEELAWEAFTEQCEVTTYPSELVREEVKNLKKQYAGFAEVSGVSTEELMKSLGMDSEGLQELAQDTVRDRMIAKTIAGWENLQPDEKTSRKYLMSIMDYDESDESYEELIQDYEEDYGSRPKDDILVKMVKELVAENAITE